jgi:hypothetical protein
MKSDKEDIALAGFLMTADEWSELDPQSQAEILVALAAPARGIASEVAAMSGNGQ